jgi:integrase/recombinase XerD
MSPPPVTRARLAKQPASEADGRAIDTFIDALWLEEGLSKNTLEAYRRDLTLLAGWLAGQSSSLAQVQEVDLNAYFAAQHSTSKATTANRRLTVFKRYFRWALREHGRTADPTLKLRAARQACAIEPCWS